ncbi:MAG: leucyl aminopeptidase [Clostridium sp.]|nr:leucyl aminopeptidase [Clostridium sp.]
MDLLKNFTKENEAILEKYYLEMEKAKGIHSNCKINTKLKNYFYETSEFILTLKEVTDKVESKEIETMSLEELKKLNQDLFNDILEENYDLSYANPELAVKTLGKELGQLLSLLYSKLRENVENAFAYKIFAILPTLKLYNEVYEILKADSENILGVKEVITAFYYDVNKMESDLYYRKFVDKSLNYYAHIIEDSDLNDLRYLYKYDSYVTDREIKIANYFNNVSEKDMDSMVTTYTEGFKRGYVLGNLNLASKKFVRVYYSIGFERMAKVAGKRFEEMGLTAIYTLYQPYYTNRQFKYDHRYNLAILFDQKYIDFQMENRRVAGEKYKELLGTDAGPAAIETFGEKNFQPINKEEAISFNKEQQALFSNFNRELTIQFSKYLKRNESSFTIIAYPTPDIGDNFEEIFNETVKVNNLDNELYVKIQQSIIDVLDQGDYVHVLGMGKNKTDIKVNLYKLNDPSKETIFENCTADVNIPVGEVFTSPVLTGTNGKLHVTEVFLNGLKYKNLEIDLKDGMIKDYTCDNFEKEEDNKKFIKENILNNHESIPIGEFAIGTNTTAYVMGQKYNIQDKLPILIAEKTGPHFAMGDTCYSMSEENKVYNPDGKEIVAKDNERSILRKTDMSKAYFGCHTDITIPYDELGEIAVYTKNGEKTVIIKDGRFVLKGTEKLNEAFN